MVGHNSVCRIVALNGVSYSWQVGFFFPRWGIRVRAFTFGLCRCHCLWLCFCLVAVLSSSKRLCLCMSFVSTSSSTHRSIHLFAPSSMQILTHQNWRRSSRCTYNSTQTTTLTLTLNPTLTNPNRNTDSKQGLFYTISRPYNCAVELHQVPGHTKTLSFPTLPFQFLNSHPFAYIGDSDCVALRHLSDWSL